MAALVLVVDDNRPSNDLMAYLFRAFGYTVEVAFDGTDGLKAARIRRPDVIVMDLQMERMGGLEAAEELAADPVLASVPRVAVTSFAMAEDRDRALRMGFDGYIAKPINPETFVREVEAFLPAELRSEAGRRPTR